MRDIKEPSQLYIFDPWGSILPERRQLLDTGWPGLFCEHILPSIPVGDVSRHFDPSMGRPAKELFAMLGALILQQAFDLTDEEAVQQFAFNIQWRYALNITEESGLPATLTILLSSRRPKRLLPIGCRIRSTRKRHPADIPEWIYRRDGTLHEQGQTGLSSDCNPSAGAADF